MNFKAVQSLISVARTAGQTEKKMAWRNDETVEMACGSVAVGVGLLPGRAWSVRYISGGFDRDREWRRHLRENIRVSSVNVAGHVPKTELKSARVYRG